MEIREKSDLLLKVVKGFILSKDEKGCYKIWEKKFLFY